MYEIQAQEIEAMKDFLLAALGLVVFVTVVAYGAMRLTRQYVEP